MVFRVGTNGPDTLFGTIFNDVLSGLAGNDILFGNAGSDRIFGGLGDDHLFPGTGNDILTGGPGTDNFYFGDGTNNIWGHDTIKDFNLDEFDTVRTGSAGPLNAVIDSGISTTLVFALGTVELEGVTTGVPGVFSQLTFNQTVGYAAIS